MRDFTDRLDSALARIQPDGEAPTRIRRRVGIRRRGRRVFAAATSLLVTAALVIGLSQAFGPARKNTSVGRAVAPRLAHIVDAVSSDDSVWVLTCEACGLNGPGRGRLLHLSRGGAEVISSTQAHAPTAMASGDGSIWIISLMDSQVTRVDAKTGEVLAIIPLSLTASVADGDNRFLPQDITVDDSGVWITTARGELARIDPASNKVTAQLVLPPDATGDVTAGLGNIWVAENVLGVYKIDPINGTIVSQFPVERSGGQRLAVQSVQSLGGLIWVTGSWADPTVDETGHGDFTATNDTAIVSIDPITGKVVSVTSTDGTGLIPSENSLWIVSADGRHTSRLDAHSGRIVRAGVRASGKIIAIGGGHLWSLDVNGRLTSTPLA